MVLPRPSPMLLTRLCLAALLANMGIVLTGALVRLTSSGLGCPTWPKCTDSSYVNTTEYGVHGRIEFTNRTLTFVLSAVVVACIVAALMQRPRRRDLVALCWALFAGIVGQAVLGGITVRTHLNPWTVAAHFLLSMVLVATAATLVFRAHDGTPPIGAAGPRPVRWLALSVTAVTAVVLGLGTVVTASGPHAGDASAARTGFDLATVSHVHAGAVMVLVALTITALVSLRVTRAATRLQRAAGVLLGLELAQGAVGYVQYFTGVPVVLVAVHVGGACLVWLAAVWLALLVRRGGAEPSAAHPLTLPAEATSTA
ncbi:MAG: COX15/CtaA family protein [Pseudonocardiales bacterium]